jgi:hypothetical protein
MEYNVSSITQYREVLRGAKSKLYPNWMMNPGVVIPPEEGA